MQSMDQINQKYRQKEQEIKKLNDTIRDLQDKLQFQNKNRIEAPYPSQNKSQSEYTGKYNKSIDRRIQAPQIQSEGQNNENNNYISDLVEKLDSANL